MNANPAPKPAPNVNPAPNANPSAPSVLNQAGPIIDALSAAARSAKVAIDERNTVRAFLLEFFKSQRTALTFLHTIDGLRASGFKASLSAPSASEKRAVILSHLAAGGSFNDLPEKLYAFARETGLVEFAHKINA